MSSWNNFEWDSNSCTCHRLKQIYTTFTKKKLLTWLRQVFQFILNKDWLVDSHIL